MNNPDNPIKLPALETFREDLYSLPNASLIQRAYAVSLDFAFFSPLLILITLPLDRYFERLLIHHQEFKKIALTMILGLIPGTFYFLLPTLLGGQTLGKRAVGIRVVAVNHTNNLTFLQVVMREVFGKALTVMTLGIGILLALFSKKNQTLHDKVSSTKVVSYRYLKP